MLSRPHRPSVQHGNLNACMDECKLSSFTVALMSHAAVIMTLVTVWLIQLVDVLQLSSPSGFTSC